MVFVNYIYDMVVVKMLYEAARKRERPNMTVDG